MKKILVLTPRFPYPVIGGDRLRIYELCKFLAKDYELSLLSLCENQAEMKMPIPDDGVFTSVERVLQPKWLSYLNCMIALPTEQPLQLAYYWSRQFKRLFDEVVDQYDAVLCHLIRMTKYALNVDRPVIVEFTDAISLNYSRVKTLAKNSGLKNRVYALEQKRLNRYEKYVGKHSSLNIFVSTIDANYLFPPGSPESLKTLVCSNGVNIDNYPFIGCRDSKEIAFIGNMQSVQNMDAAKWFAKNVMSLLVKEGFSFKVVGRASEANKEVLERYKGVKVTGAVDSIAEEVASSFVGVCPMRIGAGIQNKILEYMALGLPCITSSMGYEGLFVPKENLYIIDDPKLIAKEIKRLHSSNLERARVSRDAREHIEAVYSWAGQLGSLIEKLKIII